MREQFVEATERCISQLVTVVQDDPLSYYSETDLHWRLFFLLKEDSIFGKEQSAKLVHAEFPTIGKYSDYKKDERGRRAHYDLVVWDPDSAQLVADFKPWATVSEFLQIKVLVAIEMKCWEYNVLPTEPNHEMIDWDILKLVDDKNEVQHGYFLNFVRLDFSKERNKAHYEKLREYLGKKLHEASSNLKILCVPVSERGESQRNLEQGWIRR